MSAPKAPEFQFTVLYFASAASYTHKQYDFLPGPLLFSDLPDVLERKYPGITEKILESCAYTVNLDYVDMEEEYAKEQIGLRVSPGDEVAIIPPVSSG